MENRRRTYQKERAYPPTADLREASLPTKTEAETRQTVAKIGRILLSNEDVESLLTSPGEAVNELERLPAKKAPGQDAVFNATAKNLPRKAVVQLSQIINAAMRLSYFPSSWKTALIVPVPSKPKDPQPPTDPSHSYSRYPR